MTAPQNQPKDKPPIFRSWKALYIFVLCNLLFWIGVFYVFTIAFE